MEREELRDHGAEDFSSERVVEGIRITPWGIKPSYHFHKRPAGPVYY